MYTDILLPIDLNHESSWRKALPTAVAYCRAFEASLHVMTVIPDVGMAIVGSFFPPDFEQKAVEQAGRDLDAFVAEHVSDGLKIETIVAYGTVYEQITSTAEALKADLIVMGSHWPELKDYLLGPNAARVVRHAKCSVLIVRD